MGQSLKFCEGTLCLKMADLAMLVQFYSILVLDQFSQCRKKRLELAPLIN